MASFVGMVVARQNRKNPGNAEIVAANYANDANRRIDRFLWRRFASFA